MYDSNVQVGQRLAIVYELVREVKDGEMYQGHCIQNKLQNKWVARRLDLESGEKREEMLLCFDLYGADADKMRNQAIRLLSENIVLFGR